MHLSFTAQDYTQEDQFVTAEYEFLGDQTTGWEIRRNGETYLTLGPGYIPLRTMSCGVCSTDIDRRFLPFPLPQVIGHEVLALGLGENSHKQYVIEINDTYAARGDVKQDAFCLAGIPTHSPERRVLGIDRLPGGFGPYILAPVHAAIPLDGVSSKAAVLMEPFAAALQAILASPPSPSDSVAVLGPRRLGSLVLAALSSYRKSHGLSFQITAITRHDHLVKLAGDLGADHVIDLRNTDVSSLENKFDIVYDTTSTPSGFETALKLSRREVHLKTTNGQVMGGISHLTELVVDELSILPFSEKALAFRWNGESRTNKTIFCFPGVSRDLVKHLQEGYTVYQGNAAEGEEILQSELFQNVLPRFDLVFVSNPTELSLAIRPNPSHENSLVRPRGAIVIDRTNLENWPEQTQLVSHFFSSSKEIHTSRCGDFHQAIHLLRENPNITKILESNLITHRFPANQLVEAYAKAKDPSSVKVVVDFV